MFNNRELLLLLNSTHERAMRLADAASEMSMKEYVDPYGRVPTKQDISKVEKGYKEHLAIVEKIRALRAQSNPVE